MSILFNRYSFLLLLIVNLLQGCGGGGSSSSTPSSSSSSGGRSPNNLDPYIQEIIPRTVTAGSDSFNLVVRGRNFTTNSTVRWNTDSLNTVFVSSVELHANISASALVNADLINVSVINNQINQSPSNVAIFEIEEPFLPTVTNVGNNDVIGHELLFITGDVPQSVDTVEVSCNNLDLRQWPAWNSRFKALVRLEQGFNQIKVTSAGLTSILDVNYSPRIDDEAVQMVYFDASDGDGTFVAPNGEPNDTDTALKRMRFNALLIQSVYAELMYNLGYGRKSFRLVRDPGNAVTVSYLRIPLTMLELNEYHDQRPDAFDKHVELFYTMQRAVEDTFGWHGKKYVGLSGFSRYEHNDLDPTQSRTIATAALGGGSFAWQGALVLHMWPSNLDELVSISNDIRRTWDYDMFGEWIRDNTFSENYAINLGGTAHELGHTFGLCHEIQADGDDTNYLMNWGLPKIKYFYSFTPEDGDQGLYVGMRTNCSGANNQTTLQNSDWFNHPNI